MDLYLRCNSLKCRVQLKERAVVTTCSHIFCLPCAETLGLSHPSADPRQCPACQTLLTNPDDAAMTILNPTEDYKTSVLSGLDPNTIMECAGRAMLFWTYQTTQEILYQEFLGKTLTEKYATLNTQMDKIIHNANAEISTLQTRLQDMQQSQDQLQKKNQELVDMYREKSKKFTQITNLYNLLKSRAMRPQIQTAASDSISQTLKTLGDNIPPQTPSSRQQNAFPLNREGVEQINRHQRSGTGSSKGLRKRNADVATMPPPSRPAGSVINRNMPNATPQHRTRLTVPPRPATGATELPEDGVMFRRFYGETPQPVTAASVGQEALSLPTRGQHGDRFSAMKTFFNRTAR